MKKFNLAASILVSIFASNVYAGGASPFYLGGAIGKSNVDNGSSQMDNHGVCEKAFTINEDCRIGDGDNTGHIYGGIQISESIAIEAGYTKLGNTASYHYTDPATITQETEGFTLSGVMRHRIGKTSPMHVYGKAGVFRWETEAESVSTHPGIVNGRVEDSGVSPILGAGVEYELNHNISLRAGWDRYFDVGENETLIEFNESGTSSDLNTLETDVDVYSAGVNFSFL